MFKERIKLRPTSRDLKNGKNCLIDSGLPTTMFKDYIDSYESLIGYVKFGWGTSIVTKDLQEKIAHLKKHNIPCFFGGSLFEISWKIESIKEYFQWCKDLDLKVVEISDGTYKIPNVVKLKAIEAAAKDFQVLSEVGLKDQDDSQMMHPKKWIEQINAELGAGSAYVITEAREAGNSGICRSNGELRFGLIEEILDSGIDPDKLIFEAPNKTLQTFFIKRVGPMVNLGNIQFNDIVGVETLRNGLRSDTMDLLNGLK